ncbi:hypothetical protein GGR50DRAFT_265720 [Xylaria sp. CBS 124048]|nr:hypothetical protein GGR50DRAFT_265720 [Xylaria sp. CBS 124048]
MGRSRKGNRRSRSNRKNNDNSSNSGSISGRVGDNAGRLEYDDDLSIYGVGAECLSLSPNSRRGRRLANNGKGGQNGGGVGGRGPKYHNSFQVLTENPFKRPGLNDTPAFQELLRAPRFQQQSNNQRRSRNRNRNNNQNHQNHQNHEPQTPTQHHDPYDYTEEDHQNGPRFNKKKYENQVVGPNHSTAVTMDDRSSNHINNHNYTRLTRSCTECSAVRRANLSLRDWLQCTLSRTNDVVESWSDEVGVARGAADEMDWQPEPVVRVVILTVGPKEENVTSEAGSEQRQQANLSGGFVGSSLVGAITGCSRGMGMGGDNKGAHGNSEGSGDDGSGGGGAGARDEEDRMTRLSSWGSRPIALRTDTSGRWKGVAEGTWPCVDSGGQGQQQLVGMVSPPESPGSSVNAYR